MAELVYPPIVKTARGLFAAMKLNLDSVGEEYVPRRGGAVLAINHTSFLDFVFAGVPADDAGHRLVRFMAKDEVFRNPIAGRIMRSMKHIPVDRTAGAAAYNAAVDSLRGGELVGVFPEATMSRSFDIKDFKTGAVRMAAEAGVPVLPVIVFGGQRMLTYGHREFKRGRAVSITVGEPLHPQPTDAADEVTDVLRNRMIELLDITVERYPDRPTNLDTTWWWPARLGGGAPTLAEAAEAEAEAKARKAAKRASKGR